MIKKHENQEEIINWFNNTYSKRGTWYLRPKKAYFVYLELLKAQKGEKLLDIACGLGRLLDASQDYGVEQYGVDISPVAIEKAKQKFPNFNLSVANAENLPFENQTFDLITCIGSIERMIDKEKVFAEMHRVGKERCKYCFLVRNSKTVSWSLKKTLGLKNEKGHQDAKNLTEWKSIFNKAGFTILEIYPDQYPLMKKKKRESLWLKKVNFKELIQNNKPIEQANEFLFLLEKND